MTQTAIICLSGGIDSATLLALALKEHKTCHALAFNYNQRHICELIACEKIARYYGVSLTKCSIDMESLKEKAALIASSPEKVKKRRSLEEIEATTLSPNYVPGRNTLFLSNAFAYSEILNASEIFFGATGDDHMFPDCQPSYFNAFNTFLNYASTQPSKVRVVTPFVNLRKSEIISLAHELKVPFELTFSCYDPPLSGVHCGLCDTCTVRKNAFIKANIPDTTQYKDSLL